MIRAIVRIVIFVCLVLVITGLVFLLFRLMNTPGGKIDNGSLIISFIGVLATFVVIGNFAQTSRIEETLKDEMETLQERLVECERKNNELTQLRQDITDNTTQINTQIEKIQNIELGLSESSKPLSKKDLGRLLKLFVGNEGDVRKYMHLYAKLLNKNSRYTVEYKDGTKEQISLVYSFNQNVLNFIDMYQCVVDTEDIDYISGLPFNEGDLLYAYQLLNEIDTQESIIQENENKKEDNISEISGKDQTTRKNK